MPFWENFAPKGLKGPFLRDDPNQDEWSEITRIMVYQMNWRIFVRSEYTDSFE